MEKTHIEGAGEFYSYYPKLVAIVTARHADKENAMTIAWHSPLSFSPPLYGVLISPKRYTHQLMLGSHEFCLNFLPLEKADLAAKIGGVKGAETDKFVLLNLKKEKALKINAPILEDAYASLECRVKERRALGDHDLFVGEVLVTHFIKGLFLPKGIVDLKKVKPALYMGADNYVSVEANSQRLIGRDIKS